MNRITLWKSKADLVKVKVVFFPPFLNSFNHTVVLHHTFSTCGEVSVDLRIAAA